MIESHVLALLTLPAAWALGFVLSGFAWQIPARLQQCWRAECRAFLGLEPQAGMPPPRWARPGWNAALTAGFVLSLGAVTAVLQWGASAQSAAATALLALLSMLIVTDLRAQLLPDELVLPGLWLGLLLSLDGVFVDSRQAVLGALVGYLLPWGIYQVHRLITRREGLGYGDMKLLALGGAWAGASAVPIILFFAAALALPIMLVALVVHRRAHGPDAPCPPMAFGPALVLAIAAVVLLPSIPAGILAYLGIR